MGTAVDPAPYAVMLLEIERVAGTSGCTSPSTIGDARLNLRKLQAPSSDDHRLHGFHGGWNACCDSYPCHPRNPWSDALAFWGDAHRTGGE